MHRESKDRFQMLKARPGARGEVFRRIDELIVKICLAMPPSSDDDYHAKMEQLRDLPELRELALLAHHIPSHMGFPQTLTDKNIVIWAHNQGAKLVERALVLA